MSQNDESIPTASSRNSRGLPRIFNMTTNFPTKIVPREVSTPQWIELPVDLTANILQRLGVLQILVIVENVCTTWRRICADPAMWRVLRMGDWHMHTRFLWRRAVDQRILWRRAVDRSQGQLLDVRINYFGDDALLNYIADRSIGLKRLTVDDYNVTRKGLKEAVKKFAHLEELHLVLMSSLQAEDIIDIGISCPNLKSFTLNARFLHSPRCYTDFARPIDNNMYALAIAGNMSNLKHLCLIWDPIGNEGLEAILDGCPNLESLDLRQCANLHGALSKKCSEQIKLLKNISVRY